MPVLNGVKYACEPCMRGHRSSKCTHSDRLLVQVRKPGRPLSSCPHTNTQCNCGGIRMAIPKASSCACGSDSNKRGDSPSAAYAGRQYPTFNGIQKSQRRRFSGASSSLIRAMKIEDTEKPSQIQDHGLTHHVALPSAVAASDGSVDAVNGQHPPWAASPTVQQPLSEVKPNHDVPASSAHLPSIATSNAMHCSSADIMGTGACGSFKDASGWSGSWPEHPQDPALYSQPGPQAGSQRAAGNCCSSKPAPASLPKPRQASSCCGKPTNGDHGVDVPSRTLNDTLKLSLGQGKMDLNSSSYSQAALAHLSLQNPASSFNLFPHPTTASPTSQICNCGDGCNCLGCAIHPYNDRTMDFVRSMNQFALDEDYGSTSNSRRQSMLGDYQFDPMSFQKPFGHLDADAPSNPSTWRPNNITNQAEIAGPGHGLDTAFYPMAPGQASMRRISVVNGTGNGNLELGDGQTVSPEECLSPTQFFHVDYTLGSCAGEKTRTWKPATWGKDKPQKSTVRNLSQVLIRSRSRPSIIYPTLPNTLLTFSQMDLSQTCISNTPQSTASDRIAPLQTSQQALLSLERSTEPPVSRIEDACRIVGISYDSLVPTLESISTRNQELALLTSSGASTAKEEWVLRWLLNNLRAAVGKGPRFLLDSKTWLLLARICGSLPAVSLARTLNGQDLLSILQGALEEARIILLRLRDGGLAVAPDSKTHSAVNGVISTNDPISAALGSPDTVRLRRSKKRKRSEIPVRDQADPIALALRGEDVEAFISSAMMVLTTIVSRAEGFDATETIDHEPYAREYTKSILRTSPELAAKLLGSSFTLISLLPSLGGHLRPMESQVARSQIWIHTMIKIWNLRAANVQDVEGKISHDAFSAHCLVSSLNLLDTFHVTSSTVSGSSSDVRSTIENLIALHIIIPARTVFFHLFEDKPKRTAKLDKDNAPNRLLELISPFGDYLSTAGKLQSLEGLSHIFGAAIKCSPPNDIKKRGTESSWLETVLVAMLNLARPAGLHANKDQLNECQTQIVEKLLRNALDEEVLLSTTVLQGITAEYGGVSNGQARWDLLALVLRLDGDVFLIPWSDNSVSPERTQSKNSLLDGLFDRLTSFAMAEETDVADGRKENVTSETERQGILDDIFRPLILAYANARDMSSFVSEWSRQLVRLEIFRETNDQCCGGQTVTILEDEEIVELVRSLLSKNMTEGQLKSLFQTKAANLRLFETGAGVESDILGDLIILETLTLNSASFGDAEPLAETSMSLFELCLDALEHEHNRDLTPRHQWRIWIIMSNSMLYGIRQWDHRGAELISRATKSAYAQYRQISGRSELVHGSDKMSIDGYENTEVCFRFGVRELAVASFIYLVIDAANRHAGEVYFPTASWVEQTLGPVFQWSMTVLDQELRAVLEMLNKSAPSESLRTIERPLWDGKRRNLRSRGRRALALSGMAILENPLRLQAFCAEGHFGRIISQLLKLATVDRVNFDETPAGYASFGSIWSCYLKNDAVLDDASLRDALIGALVYELASIISTVGGSSLKDGLLETVLTSLMKLPVGVFSREQREKILNLLAKNVILDLDEFETLDVADLMHWRAQLMQFSNSSTELATNLEALLHLANKIPIDDGYCLHRSLAAYEQLVREVFGHHLSTRKQKRSEAFFEKTPSLLQSVLHETKTFVDKKGLARLTLLKTAILTLSELSEMSQFHDFEMELFTMLSSELESAGFDTNQVERSYVLNALADVVDVRRRGKRSFPKASNESLKKYMIKSLDEIESPKDVDSIRTLPTRLISLYRLTSIFDDASTLLRYRRKILAALEVGGPEDGAISDGVSDINVTALASVVEQSAADLSEDDRLAFLSSHLGIDNASALGSRKLRWIKSILRTIEDISVESKGAIARAYDELCVRLQHTREVHRALAIVECMDSLLLEKPRAISQYNIERTLMIMVITVSPTSKLESSGSSSDVFGMIAQLFTSILKVHRLKLGGRYHLVLPVLQALLRCLFERRAWLRGKESRVHLLPPWLGVQTSGRGARDGMALARLLSSLCDPTVSSVTGGKHRARDELTPARDKARGLAGQHLPYVLVEYAQCQLQSRMSPEVKAALLPGLWAVFSVASQDMLRVINSAMDPACQAVFKSLYENYNQFGRSGEI
ncbi:MAG: hypothetical protein M1825_002700 [Sarcosagium campestre]|nr:MAG: hypothetical protein M1825_002700 [Sarcosagium campestre]